MNKVFRRLLSYLFLAALLAACLPSSGGGIQLPSMEIPLRDFSTSQPVLAWTPTLSPTAVPTATATLFSPQPLTATPTITPLPYPLWIDPSVPDVLREVTLEWNLPSSESASLASLQLGLATPSDSNKSTWFYALVAPFPTVLDGVTLAELESAWSVSSPGPFDGAPLWMTESTLSAFTALWG